MSPPLVAAVAESHSWSLCQKPPKRRQTSKAPNPMRKEPPSKANSFGVCTIGMRAEPVSNTPKKSKGNLKPQHVRWLRFHRDWSADLRKFMKYAQQPVALGELLNTTICFDYRKIDWSLIRCCLRLSDRLPGKPKRASLWWLSFLSLVPCWWWQEFHRVELWAMLDQKFSKIPQMGDVASNLRCDRQITGVIIRAHVR